MAIELSLQSLKNQLQNLSNHSKNQSDPYFTTVVFSMRNPKQARQDDDDDEEDSWEVRAFAEDAANVMGTTWPPRSYTCTFCRREFRSAQALGGHMNVHRRDRLRFRHLSQAKSIKPISSSSSSSFTIPPDHKVVAGSSRGGFCFLYQLSNPNGSLPDPTTSQSSILSISPYPSTNSMLLPSASIKSPVEHRGTSSSSSHCSQISGKGDESLISTDDGNEKLDLELRLGHRPSSS